MGKKDATREEVMEALKNAQCEDIIEKLAGWNGYGDRKQKEPMYPVVKHSVFPLQGPC